MSRTQYRKPLGLGMRWNKTIVTCAGQRLNVIVERDGRRWMLTVIEWQQRTYHETMRAAQAAVEEIRLGNLAEVW